jgi:hypothetical protein
MGIINLDLLFRLEQKLFGSIKEYLLKFMTKAYKINEFFHEKSMILFKRFFDKYFISNICFKLCSLLIFIVLSACYSNQERKSMTIEEYGKTFVKDSISTTLKGVIYGLSRDSKTFSLKLPNNIWVSYYLRRDGNFKIISFKSNSEDTDTVNIAQKIKPIIDYALKYNITAIQSNESYMTVTVADVFEKGSKVCFLICYESLNTVLARTEVTYHKPKEVTTNVLYYKYK